MALRRSALDRAAKTVSPEQIRQDAAVARFKQTLAGSASAPQPAPTGPTGGGGGTGTFGPVESSMLSAVRYDVRTQALTVDFVKGGTYTYSQVPFEVAQSIVEAPSVGKAMHAEVLGTYAYHRDA